MATLRFELILRSTLAGEEKRVEHKRDFTLATGDVVLDAATTIAENTAAAPVTAWQDAKHGVAAPVASFAAGVVLVSPAAVPSVSLPIDVELSWTNQAGAVTSRVIRVPPESALPIHPVGGASGTTMTDVLTRIRYTNPAGVGSPAGSNAVQVRALLVK